MIISIVFHDVLVHVVKRLDVTIAQLELFTLVAKTGSMTAAAGLALTTQSNVSVAIAKLERTLETELVVRHRAKGVSVTPSGAEVLRRAGHLLQTARELQEWARSEHDELAGELRVGCFLSLAPFYLPLLLRGLRERAPLIEVTVREGSMDALDALVADGELDLALVYDQGIPASLRFFPILDVHPYVIVAADSPLAGRGTIRLRDLVGEPMVSYDLPFAIERSRSLFDMVGVPRPREVTATSIEALRALVGAGLGFAVLNQRWATDVTATGAQIVELELELDDRLPPLRMGTVVRGSDIAAKVRLVHEILTEGATSEHSRVAARERAHVRPT